MTPRISLIVCTRNRAARLSRFLDRVAQLEPPPGGWELVLVDNASTDGTKDVLATFAGTAPITVHSVYAPVPGLARSRNTGLAAASGDILVFTDDDCYPQADYLVAMSRVFDEYRPGFVGGRVVLHDPEDARVTVRDAAEPEAIPPHIYFRPGLIHGANMAVTREVVRAIGGFDPHLGAGTDCVAGEDAEYLARAVWGGWSGRYDPRPMVAHHHGRKPGADAERQSRGYDYGRGAYFARLMLHRTARSTYVSYWWRRARRVRERHKVQRLGRELIGACRYLRAFIFGSERVPRFDHW